ncbi:hypothetical protein [Actinoplanes sp. RD1]|uniref:hypothetical protein n=1 Tax=Actinoplanes sp. RD1 TaxID=3064538 RepID=UPI0027406503|nr:hypothetical protein [Actinoplanes sp. RD1]
MPLLAPEPLRPVLPVDDGSGSLLLDMARLDASGRFSARVLLRVLGWTAQQRVDLTVAGDALIIGSSPTGRQKIGVRGELAVPGSTRAMLGLDEDPRVVLVAALDSRVLVVHPHTVVAQLLAGHYRREGVSGGG